MMRFGTPLDAPIISVLTAYINEGKVEVDFSCVSSDVPAVDLAQPEIDVGDQRSIFTLGHVKQLDCIFARRSCCCLESAISKVFLDAGERYLYGRPVRCKPRV
jgi:hypothetical protein